MKNFLLLLSSVFLVMQGVTSAFFSVTNDEDGVLLVVQKMMSEFKKMEDLTCEAEVLFFKNGKESKTFQLRYLYKKEGRFRVEFVSPHRGLTVLYQGGDEELTVQPFKFIPAVKLHFSIYNSLVKTPTGQRIDQTGWEYFLQFITKNSNLIANENRGIRESEDYVKLSFWAMDYLEGKALEKYILVVSKKNWLPLYVERFDQGKKPVDITIFKKWIIDSGLKENLFRP